MPNAGGNGTVGNGQRPNGDDPTVAAATRAALPTATIKALGRKGDSGQDAAALAGAAAPPGTSNRIPLEAPAPGNPLAAAGRIVTGSSSGGMGLLFPLLLVAGTLAVAGAALWRRRDTSA